MRILKEDAAAVIIDLQERLFPHIAGREGLEHNLDILIRGLRALEIPLLVTQQYTRGLGETTVSMRKILQPFDPVEKISFSCSDEPRFTAALERFGKKKIIVAGIEAHVCVQQTAVDLLAEGYTVILVENCISSRHLDDKRIAVKRMHSEGALPATYESILFELCRFAGTDTFKTISKLVK